MDLIYTNPALEDIGVLREYELDLAFGADENNFECTIQANAHCCEAGSFLYFEGTEYGGIIDGIQSDSSTNEVVYSGRTWHGILNSKVFEPDSGADYLIVSGEANAVLGALIKRLNLSDMYEASSEDSGLTISKYQMHRYITGYDGITKMLDSVGARMHLTFQNGKVILSAVPKHDFSQDEEFNTDQVGFRIKKNYRAVNHLICLGSGQLADRLVVHLYVDTDGNISRTQTQFDMAEVSSIYEYSSISTEEELVKEGTAKLKSLNESEEVSIDFDADADIYDVGDVIGAYDTITGLYITTKIAKKIVTIKNGQITISLSPDTAKTGSTMEVGGSVVIEDGSGGADGEDGFSPTVDVTEETDGYTVAITDKDGTETFKLLHGKDGEDGKDGATGAAGKDGEDGISVTDATVDSSGHLILTLSNGDTIDCGAVIVNADGSAFLPLTGGTLSGNLFIEKASAPQVKLLNTTTGRAAYLLAGSTGATYVYCQLDSNNNQILRLNPETYDLDEALQLVRTVGGTMKRYNLLHSGNGGLKVETGSYVGTGLSNEANANSLTFSAPPVLVFIFATKNNYGWFWSPGFMEAKYSASTTTMAGQNVTVSDNTLTWYYGTTGTSYGVRQLNDADVTYQYWAIVGG